LRRLKVRVEVLFSADPTQIAAAIDSFTKIHAFRYPAFVISQQQGRGIDFPTTQEIEANGGVHVLISSVPSQFLEL
jgi:hypothetical protein